MRPSWTDERKDISAELARQSRWLVASDFDGTLAPIVAHPEEAALLTRARLALASLSAIVGTSVALVSGRALPDLIARADLDGLSYAGNHGLEIRSTAEGRWQHPEAAPALEAVAAAARALAASLAGIPAAQVEDKGLTLSVHFRRTPHELVGQVLTAVEAQAAVAHALEIHTGKSVIELRPPIDWHKGSALLRLAERAGLPASAIVYLGDDATDEDAFRALVPHGALTFHVGVGPTSARWQVAGPDEACEVLEFLADRLAVRPEIEF